MRVTIVSPFDPALAPAPAPAPEPAAAPAGAHVGGVERALGSVARELVALGQEVTVVCSTAGPAGESVERGVRVLREPRRGLVFRAPVAALAGRVPEDADVVHVPATYPFTTPAVLRRSRRRGQPCVLDFHFEPHAPGWIGALAARAYRRVGPRAYRWADAVVVRSMAYAREAPSLAGVAEDRWRVVPNGVDPRVFHPTAAHHPGRYLLCVGRLVPYKGVEVLLHALARGQGPGLPLLVAGDGPLRPRLQAEAARLGVDARFLGRVPDEALPRLYRGARLTVLPSVNRQEAFGICLLESMACGAPVVASALPGVAEVAALGGLTARPGDPADLRQALVRGAAPGILPRGPALAARIHRDYAWSAVAARFLAVYREVAGRARWPPATRLPGAPGTGDRGVMAPAHPRGHALL